ncbi:MAG: hypothetical protein EA359_13475 [Balneolaceae bacterium]|nr:MAG: hypothetical protein EA359_13475 [Balneolaceae bacterium]
MLILTGNGYSQDTGSGLDFLNIGPSPRLLAISEASVATLTGPSAIYTNPALLAFEERSSIDASYTLWISNVDNQFAAANFRHHNWAFAAGVYNSTSDGFQARDQPGPSAGEFSIGYLSLSGAAAYTFGPVSVGGSIQYLREEVFQFRANGYAVSGGVAAEFLDRRVRAALSAKNFGSMESLDLISTPLPSTFSAGISASLIEFITPGENDLPVLISVYADWSKPIEENTNDDFHGSDSYFSIALNADVSDLFSLQGGYRFGSTERPYSFGMGLSIEPIRINYAIVPFSTGFGTVHSFGIQYFF